MSLLLILLGCPTNPGEEKPDNIPLPVLPDATGVDGDGGMLNCTPNNHDKDCYQMCMGKPRHISLGDCVVPKYARWK